MSEVLLQYNMAKNSTWRYLAFTSPLWIYELLILFSYSNLWKKPYMHLVFLIVCTVLFSIVAVAVNRSVLITKHKVKIGTPFIRNEYTISEIRKIIFKPNLLDWFLGLNTIDIHLKGGGMFRLKQSKIILEALVIFKMLEIPLEIDLSKSAYWRKKCVKYKVLEKYATPNEMPLLS